MTAGLHNAVLDLFSVSSRVGSEEQSAALYEIKERAISDLQCAIIDLSAIFERRRPRLSTNEMDDFHYIIGMAQITCGNIMSVDTSEMADAGAMEFLCSSVDFLSSILSFKERNIA